MAFSEQFSRQWRVCTGTLLAFGLALLTSSVALAAGEVVQKTGAAGCVTETGTGGECHDGRGIGGTAAVAISPDGESAYAASSGGDGVSILDRDPLTGTLTPIASTAGCFYGGPTGSNPECTAGREMDAADDVAISADGKSVYVAGRFDGAIVVFDRDPATGLLTLDPGVTGCINDNGSNNCTDGHGLAGATSIAISPDDTHVYVASMFDFSVAVLDRNTTPGSSLGDLTQDPGPAGCINENGADGCTDGNNQKTSIENVEISPDGASVYATASGSHSILVYDRNTANGDLIEKPGSAGCINESGGDGCQDGTAILEADSLAVSPNGQNVYVASKLSSAISVFDRNRTPGPNLGELTQKPGTAGCISETGRSNPFVPATAGACQDGTGIDLVTSVAVMPNGNTLYGAARTSAALTIFERNPATGVLTQKPGTTGCISESGGGPCRDGRALQLANHVTTSADGQNVYTAAAGSGGVASFELTPPDDVDSDGHKAPPGGGDCDDSDARINPDATEIFDAADNDCDGVVDEGFTDQDQDGHALPPGGDDCDDSDASVHPGAQEVLDPANVDEDCDGAADCEDPSRTGDSNADGDAYTLECGEDCNDSNIQINPGAFDPPGNGIDEDCSGADAVRPNTTISSGPSGMTTQRRPRFGFTAIAGSYPANAFECKVDSGAWASCTSGQRLTRLSLGRHTFRVRALDEFSYPDPTPAKRSFRVVGNP